MSDFLKVYGPILALIAVGFVVAYQFVDPAPPRTLTLATGSPEGAYHAYGGRYREILARDWGEMAERTAGGALLCTPDQAVDRILEYVEAGADEVNIALRAPWDEEALDAYLETVMPAVRKATA